MATNRKDACINGHLFTRGNTYVAPNGSRMCRICRQRAKRKFTEKIQAQQQAQGRTGAP